MVLLMSRVLACVVRETLTNSLDTLQLWVTRWACNCVHVPRDGKSLLRNIIILEHILLYMLKWLQMSRICYQTNPGWGFQGIFFIHCTVTLKSFRIYTLEASTIVHTALLHPQRTQAKSLLSDIFPLLRFTGEESCIHLLNSRQKIVCRWNCRQNSTTII
jgi:hypothetical protein